MECLVTFYMHDYRKTNSILTFARFYGFYFRKFLLSAVSGMNLRGDSLRARLVAMHAFIYLSVAVS